MLNIIKILERYSLDSLLGLNSFTAGFEKNDKTKEIE